MSGFEPMLRSPQCQGLSTLADKALKHGVVGAKGLGQVEVLKPGTAGIAQLWRCRSSCSSWISAPASPLSWKTTSSIG